jgi:O-acetyl-ADP-ribose deacetylase (regulator of RNase III)
MYIVFISLNKVWTDELRKLLEAQESITIIHGNVKDLPRTNTTFVSPANSLGFMDGGIDYVYSRVMFSGVENAVQQKIAEIGKKTALGRPYLPIGQAIAVPTSTPTAHLIAAPTMFLPHDVSKTQNAYASTLAALALHAKYAPETTLVLTSHCCGYGKMDEAESAKQMIQALHDFRNNRTPVDEMLEVPDYVAYPSRDNEQPNCYDNREIKEIKITDLLF